jgi:ribonuclease BN (tRNA processing enzyme)
VRAVILGSGGALPSDVRETACVLIRQGDRALLLDLGTGSRRLVTDPTLLTGVRELNVLLTHFHLDHVYGLPYLDMLAVDATVWAPGRWLYGGDSETILAPLLRPPVAPSDVGGIRRINELREGEQSIAGFDVRASAQPRHWAPTAGLRIDDDFALITDTPYEATSRPLAQGARHLLHEAWSSSRNPISPDRDATAADAARVAREAAVDRLTLIHLNPVLPEHSLLLADATPTFERVTLGEDEAVLETASQDGPEV